ncbi:hypothetical protein EJ06DRAFT_415616 [Trichodelitschia bisporula]|uniref:Uncharacterized protein n=1 Tax=Trichodelitschia bisporula TaxID=703511 RepID=A0A6G1HY50_9PEZI|nr:hypothetical protein EJ06DRAFT_415616 [Trichodelitschia bisporula]
MEVHDNPSVKPSGLRPPSKVQTSLPLPTTKGLVEMTASDNNVRIAPSTGTTSSTMGPPPGSLKHRPYGLPESQPKQRKTLKDRAAEPIRPPSATSTYKESISGRGPVARNGFSSSTRVPPPTRTTSNSSYGQSTFRASAMPRPNTALGHSRTNSYGGSLKQGHAQDRRGFSNSSQPAAAPAALEDTSETQFKDFQNMFTKMQAQMTGTTFAQNALKELVEMLKARGKRESSLGETALRATPLCWWVLSTNTI